VAASILWYGAPTAIPIALLVAPPVGDSGHFGLIIVYGLGGAPIRIWLVMLMGRLIPILGRSMAYARGMLATTVGFVVFGFFLLIGAWSLIRCHLGHWQNMIMVPLLSAYEFLGSAFVERMFIRRFVEDAEARRIYSGTQQGILPSMGVAMLHGNAEAARLGLLLTNVATREDIGFCSAIILSFCWNLADRSGWVFRWLQVLFSGMGLSNLRRLYYRSKFNMGYPRFFALASVMLSRLALGHPMLPSRMSYLAVGLVLTQEVVEDVFVYLAGRGGCDAFPLISTPKFCGNAQPKPNAWCDPVPDSFQPEASKELQTYAFKHQPQEQDTLPLWAHFVAIFLAQLNLVMALALGGWGVPYLLGFCAVHPRDTGCWSRGLVWWPPLDLARPCQC